jgi:hypothetical protein
MHAMCVVSIERKAAAKLPHSKWSYLQGKVCQRYPGAAKSVAKESAEAG